jgi:hypothetical protein
MDQQAITGTASANAPSPVAPGPAALLQQARVAADLANHRERLLWLAADRPRWSCGTPVDAHTRNVLRLQSVAALAASA